MIRLSFAHYLLSVSRVYRRTFKLPYQAGGQVGSYTRLAMNINYTMALATSADEISVSFAIPPDTGQSRIELVGTFPRIRAAAA
jgi:hypothetical protein